MQIDHNVNGLATVHKTTWHRKGVGNSKSPTNSIVQVEGRENSLENISFNLVHIIEDTIENFLSFEAILCLNITIKKCTRQYM